MYIAGLVVKVNSNQVQKVVEKLKNLPGVEFHDVADNSNVAIVLETETIDEAIIIHKKIETFPGVTGVFLAYQNFEDLTKEFNSIA